MTDIPELKFDTIGYWSEIKLDIIREYAGAYSKILSAQRLTLYHIYCGCLCRIRSPLIKDYGGVCQRVTPKCIGC